ncbi:MAG: polysaccharide biosynthesis tyrosine autokinase [Bacteroidota bacterium]
MAAPYQTPPRTPTERPDAPILVEEPVYVRDQKAGDIDLREIIDLAIRGKWIVLGTLVALLIPTVLFTMWQPNMYRATATILVENNDDAQAVMPGSGATNPLIATEPNLQNELLLLEEDIGLAELAAREVMQYEKDPETQQPLTILRRAAQNGQPTIRSVGLLLQGPYTSANTAGQEVDAIRVTAQSENPGEAALLANLYAEAFVDVAQTSSRGGVTAVREFLEEQVSDKDERLREADAAVENYMNRSGAVALQEETTDLVSNLGALDGQLDATNIEIQTKQAEITAIREQIRDAEARQPGGVTDTSPIDLAASRQELQQVESQIQQFELRNPDFQGEMPEDMAIYYQRREQLREQIREAGTRAIDTGSIRPGEVVAEQIEALRAQLSAAEIRLRSLQASRQSLRGNIAEREGELAQVPGQSITLAQLQRARTAAEQTYSSLESRLQETLVAEQSELGYARIIRPAFVPTMPFAPNRPRNIILALFLGLTFGIVFAVARVRLDHRLFRPDDIQNMGFALVGTIPDTDALIKKDFGGKDFINVDGKEVDAHLITLLNPMATASETYRALRTSVQFSRPDAMIESILVTSPNPGEGKSVTASNLAVVIAQSGRRVLLVDGDLRRPTVHRKFGLSREPGLVQRLFDDRPLSLADFDQPADDLYVLPAGSLAPNPSELLGSKRMRDLMDEFKTLFDVVIFDVPPVLAATDAVLLSTQVDATLLVVRSGRTRDYELESANDALRNVGAKVIGTVLNGFHISKAYGYRYKYAYRYGRDYAYGYGQKKN